MGPMPFSVNEKGTNKMAIELVEIKKNTRGINSREIKYLAIGKWVEKIVQRDTRPAFNEDGTKKLDDKGNEVRLPLEKDAEGKNIYVDEIDLRFETEGVLTDMADAVELCKGDEQVLLDCFVEGFNERQYKLEADKDELDEFLIGMGEMNDDQKNAFKKTARQIARNYDMSLVEAAEQVQGLMLKAKAKAEAKAKAAAETQTVTA